MFFQKHFDSKIGPYRNVKLGNFCLICSGSLFAFALFCFFYLLPKYGNLWGILYILSFIAAGMLRSVGISLRRPQKTYTDVTSEDKKIILYLRSFIDDSSFIPGNNPESSIVASFGNSVRTIGIGIPEDIIQKLGVERIYFPRDSEEWRIAVTQLIGRSSLIVVCFNSSSNLLWEIDQIIENNGLSKALFYFPVLYKRNNSGLYAAFRHLFDSKYEISVPKLEGKEFRVPQLVSFPDSTKGAVLNSKGTPYKLLNLLCFGRPRSALLIVHSKLIDYIQLLHSKSKKTVFWSYTWEISGRILLYLLILWFFLYGLFLK